MEKMRTLFPTKNKGHFYFWHLTIQETRLVRNVLMCVWGGGRRGGGGMYQQNLSIMFSNSLAIFYFQLSHLGAFFFYPPGSLYSHTAAWSCFKIQNQACLFKTSKLVSVSTPNKCERRTSAFCPNLLFLPGILRFCYYVVSNIYISTSMLLTMNAIASIVYFDK